MSEAVLERTEMSVLLAHTHALIDEMQTVDLTTQSDDELLDSFRELERLRRRLPSLDHALIAEAKARSFPGRHMVRNMTQFLRGLLRLDPHEAAGRVRASDAAAPRRSLAGEQLPPAFPEVAAAQSAGAISDRHARVIVDTVEKLPDTARAEHGVQVEADLVGHAQRFDPQPLARLAQRISDCLDPDGRLKDDEYRERTRDFRMQVRPDGSSRATGELNAELTELLRVHFDAFAAPRPAVDGQQDPRTVGQRQHDAMIDALKLNLRAQQVPDIAGVTASVVVTMTAEQYLTGDGLARTGHGALVPAKEALRWAGGDYRLMAVVIDRIKGITAYSSSHRLFTEGQRLAIAAIDGGCTFPGCPMPAGQSEVHHMIDHAKGGPTSVDNGVLACGYDNRTRPDQGWRATRINGRAAWIPPPWIDPEQRPRYNDVHRC